MISALIVAAGQGKRMGGAQPKQFLSLAGRPILYYSLKAFDRVPFIDQVILVVAADQIDYCRDRVVKSSDVKKTITLVAGGKQRQDSVFKGLQSIDGDDGFVLIHDGVRPLVSSTLIEACLDGARQWGACVPGIPPVDTLKQIDSNGFIQSTVPRQTLRQIQTPQAFRLQLIRQAHALAVSNQWQATDDAALVERMGRPVHVIPGESTNIKVTTPQDLILAQAFLKSFRAK